MFDVHEVGDNEKGADGNKLINVCTARDNLGCGADRRKFGRNNFFPFGIFLGSLQG